MSPPIYVNIGEKKPEKNSWLQRDNSNLQTSFCCICSSGHTEKAVACLQAMVELNCFCSPELEKNTPVTGQMAFLETFWDSGQPRYNTLSK